MFDLLDNTLDKLLNADELNAAPLNVVFQKLYNADVSFLTPEKSYPQTLLSENAVNLFLYEVKENRELREPGPTTRNNTLGIGSVCRRAPLRVDCAFMVTAWSKAQVEPVKVSHNILGLAFNWLSRFPVIPDRYLQLGGLGGQVYAPPTMVAQMDGAKGAGEFWHALGIPPRPYFNLVVTITMDLDQQIDDSIVTTIASNYHAGDPANGEEYLIIGGAVRDKGSGNALADAWVRLEPLNLTQVTDAAGRFIFENVPRRGGITLRARARDYKDDDRLIEIPSISGEYDIQLTKLS